MSRIQQRMADPAFQDEVFATIRAAIVDEHVPPALRLKAALKCLDKQTPSLKSVDHQGLNPVAITFVSCLDGAFASRQEALDEREKRRQEAKLPPSELPWVPSMSEGPPPAKEDFA